MEFNSKLLSSKSCNLQSVFFFFFLWAYCVKTRNGLSLWTHGRKERRGKMWDSRLRVGNVPGQGHESVRSADASTSIIDETKWQRIFRKACWLVVCLSCNINWHCCCCSSEKPSVQNSYFSLPNDLFTATLNWTVIRLLQVGSVVSALTCFWKWIDSLRSLEKWRKIFTIELPELKRRNLTDKQWIN